MSVEIAWKQNILVTDFHLLKSLLKPVQNKKGQKDLGYPKKSSPFIWKKTAFFSGTSNFFGPSYFEVALVTSKKMADFSKILWPSQNV